MKLRDVVPGKHIVGPNGQVCRVLAKEGDRARIKDVNLGAELLLDRIALRKFIPQQPCDVEKMNRGE
jgi:hypothetical protein